MYGENAGLEDEDWRRVWNLNVLERVKSFMWLLKHDRLLTNASKSKMGLGSTMCSLCKKTTKTPIQLCVIVTVLNKYGILSSVMDKVACSLEITCIIGLSIILETVIGVALGQ